VKVHLDEDLSPAIAAALRQRGIDAVSAHEGALGLSDAAQLRVAAAAGRVLVTRNARHFIAATEEAMRRAEPHAGVVISEIARAIETVARRYPQGLEPYAVVYLPPGASQDAGR
jgi:predicted nuclease of predicted toxin-antitoxin system